jgi:hypothetical protein
MTPSDAQGRYDSEPTQLRIKPKVKPKTVPRIKIKDEYQKKTPTEPIGNLLSVDLPPGIHSSDFGAFETQTQELTFDPRGGILPAETSTSTTFQPTLATEFALTPQLPQHMWPISQEVSEASPSMHIMTPQPPQLADLPAQSITPLQAAQVPSVVEPQVAFDDFGDFATCPPSATSTPPVDAVNSLCSLESLSLNASSTLPHSLVSGCGILNPGGTMRETYAQHAAFTGLDGFSTAPQPMRTCAVQSIPQPAPYGQMPNPNLMGQFLTTYSQPQQPRPPSIYSPQSQSPCGQLHNQPA